MLHHRSNSHRLFTNTSLSSPHASNFTLLLFHLSRRLSTADPIFSHLSTVDSKAELLKSYTVTPPIKPWPLHLHPKRLVSMIKRQQNLDLALQIFDHAGKFHPGFSHTYETYHAMIEKLSRARAFDHMEILLHQLQCSRIKCKENVFVVVVRNYGIANKPKLAFKSFLQIKHCGIEFSVRSFNTLLNSMIQCRRFDTVGLLFNNSKKKFGIIPNVFTCNILIKALCKKNNLEGAIKVLDEMPGLGLVPNVVTYTTILGGYCGRGDLHEGKRVFDEILSRGWIPDAITYTILIDGFCKQGRLMEGVKIMDEMEENGVFPNDVTYGVVIESYCREKKSGEALNLLEDMLEKKFVPSSTLCCKVIDVLCEEGKVDDACVVWKKLLKKNCTPDNSISSTLIYWLCKKGKIWEARKLFEEFEKGSIPSILTYNALILGMCESGELQEAGRLWDDMVEKKCVPNVSTYNVLIKGFCKSGKAREGVRVLEEMLEKGCMPNKFTYKVLVDGLYESGMEEEIMEVLLVALSSREILLDLDSWGVFVKKVAGDLEKWRLNLDRVLENDS